MSLITEYDATVMQAQTFIQLGGGNGQQITPQEIQAAQQAWCDGLLEVCAAYQSPGVGNNVAMTNAAQAMLNDLYDYTTPDGGNVFFRPTLTFGATTFRPTQGSALSYFAGNANALTIYPNVNSPTDYSADTGFAKNYWQSASFTNTSTQYVTYQIFGNIGITMGNVTLGLSTTPQPGDITVDKVFIFRKDAQGNLKIILHKSALSNPAQVDPYP